MSDTLLDLGGSPLSTSTASFHDVSNISDSQIILESPSSRSVKSSAGASDGFFTPPLSPGVEVSTNAGIVTTDSGERVIPSTPRKDGSVRKEIKVRPGFTPAEDIARYNVAQRVQMRQQARESEIRDQWTPVSAVDRVDEALAGLALDDDQVATDDARPTARRQPIAPVRQPKGVPADGSTSWSRSNSVNSTASAEQDSNEDSIVIVVNSDKGTTVKEDKTLSFKKNELESSEATDAPRHKAETLVIKPLESATITPNQGTEWSMASKPIKPEATASDALDMPEDAATVPVKTESGGWGVKTQNQGWGTKAESQSWDNDKSQDTNDSSVPTSGWDSQAFETDSQGWDNDNSRSKNNSSFPTPGWGAADSSPQSFGDRHNSYGGRSNRGSRGGGRWADGGSNGGDTWGNDKIDNGNRRQGSDSGYYSHPLGYSSQRSNNVYRGGISGNENRVRRGGRRTDDSFLSKPVGNSGGQNYPSFSDFMASKGR
ncbi:hypothetical protein V1512DRAFT_262244 [Lipomyces arxii]|uniref:uncharacterized protein n=1 Tax=Lipomyces arxii TaxID=56418 RepID=UPI0034CDCAD5